LKGEKGFLCPLRFFPKYGLPTFQEAEESFKHGIVHCKKIEWRINISYPYWFALSEHTENSQKIKD
jgi:hypothetical protein